MHRPDTRDIEPPASPPSTNELHVCPMCKSELVSPLEWKQAGPRHWEILLRCPDCEELIPGIYDQALVERFDNEMDRATAELLGDLRRITHANMAEEAEFFIRALNADVIVPSDF